MALKIGLVSQKGGPGKSTLARALAVAYAQNDWSAKIADLDVKQATSTEWLKLRLQNGHAPEVAAEPFGNVAQALRKADDYDVLIFDGAPHASIATADVAKASDLVIIPTGLSVDDLRPAVVLAEELRAKNGIEPARIVFALNHVGDSARELEEAQAYLAQTSFHTLDGCLPQKTAYSRAHDQGLAVIETPYKGPREMAERLIQAAIIRAAELTN